MVEPAGDQSHAARPNGTPRQELAREGLRDSSSLDKKNTGLNSQSALLGRPRDSAGDEVVAPKLEHGQDYHCFLSHVWSTGQDQMRVLKQQLLEHIPDLSIFLDVDDLKGGKGSEYVLSAREVPSSVLCRPWVPCIRDMPASWKPHEKSAISLWFRSS